MAKGLALIVTTVAACFYATNAHAAAQAGAPASDPAGQTAEAAQNTDPGPAAADTQTPKQDKDGWEFSTTSYLWGSSVKSQITTPQGEQVSSKTSFLDLLGDLKFAFMGAAQAKHGRFVMVGDLMYTNLGVSADGHLGPVPLDVREDTKLLITTLEAGYRVVDRGPMFLDLMGGARLTSLKASLDITGPLNTVERNVKVSHVAPVLAARFGAPLGGKWSADLYGDVAGFGVSQGHQWQLLGTIQYRLSEHWQLMGGWRHLSVKESQRNFDLHVAMDGPIFGVTYRM